jgi:hypothetical protein
MVKIAKVTRAQKEVSTVVSSNKDSNVIPLFFCAGSLNGNELWWAWWGFIFVPSW